MLSFIILLMFCERLMPIATYPLSYFRFTKYLNGTDEVSSKGTSRSAKHTKCYTSNNGNACARILESAKNIVYAKRKVPAFKADTFGRQSLRLKIFIN
jgi:hypothetical protein